MLNLFSNDLNEKKYVVKQKQSKSFSQPPLVYNKCHHTTHYRVTNIPNSLIAEIFF